MRDEKEGIKQARLNKQRSKATQQHSTLKAVTFPCIYRYRYMCAVHRQPKVSEADLELGGDGGEGILL